MSADLSQRQQLHQHIWAMIIAGSKNPASDLHWPMLASTTLPTDHEPAAPNVRTVVLRAASADQLWLECHSDVQTEKIMELRQQPVAMLAFHDRPSRQQIRIRGEVSIHNEDEIARQAWSALSARQRNEYADSGHFAVLRLNVQSIDWLRLSKPTHERARLEYSANNNPTDAPSVRRLTS